MLVSINIVAYNEEENIRKSLASVFGQSYTPIEVFLIDNASSDKTIEAAKEVAEELLFSNTPPGPPTQVLKNNNSSATSVLSFNIIKNKENLGFGGGHNVGFRNSHGELVLCLNADCELDKDYVKYAVEVFKKNPEAGGAQGKLLNPRTKKIDTAGLLIFKNRRVINRGQGDDDLGQYNAPEEIWGVDGAAPVYRRTALEDTKIPIFINSSNLHGIHTPALRSEYFDEDFFAYKEDIDLSWRMRLAGWKMYYEPRAVAVHDRSAGEGTAKNIFDVARARRKISPFSKYHSFANQRLMQIKDESPTLFLKHSYAILPKELLAWPYALVFERRGAKSAYKFFKFIKKMLKKRKVVMSKKRLSDDAMEGWFI